MTLLTITKSLWDCAGDSAAIPVCGRRSTGPYPGCSVAPRQRCRSPVVPDAWSQPPILLGATSRSSSMSASLPPLARPSQHRYRSRLRPLRNRHDRRPVRGGSGVPSRAAVRRLPALPRRPTFLRAWWGWGDDTNRRITMRRCSRPMITVTRVRAVVLLSRPDTVPAIDAARHADPAATRRTHRGYEPPGQSRSRAHESLSERSSPVGHLTGSFGGIPLVNHQQPRAASSGTSAPRLTYWRFQNRGMGRCTPVGDELSTAIGSSRRRDHTAAPSVTAITRTRASVCDGWHDGGRRAEKRREPMPNAPNVLR